MVNLLNGLRIIDLTSVIMGPYATQILADLGADVIKIESPSGDTMRNIGPMVHEKMGWMFLHANRNKRSVAIDLKKPAGRTVLLDLIKTADVFVSNVRPDALRRLKIDYNSIVNEKEDIIYVNAYGFEDDGPYAGNPAYDDLIQGLAAIPSLMKEAGSVEPRYAPTLIADRVAGLHIVYSVLAAVIYRNRTGDGQNVEVPMFTTLARTVLSDHIGGRTFEPSRGDVGYSRLLSENRKPYETKDGFICVIVYTDAQWTSFLSLVGKGEIMSNDDRFRDVGARTSNIDYVYGVVKKELRKRTTEEWLDLLGRADIPVGRLNTIESLLEDKHLNGIGFFESVNHPTEGAIVNMRAPVRWRLETEGTDRGAPQLGADTCNVLEELGYDAAKLMDLKKGHVVY